MHARNAARQHRYKGHVCGHPKQPTPQQRHYLLIGLIVSRVGEEGACELGVKAVPVVQDLLVGWDKFVTGDVMQNRHV